MNTVSRRAD